MPLLQFGAGSPSPAPQQQRKRNPYGPTMNPGQTPPWNPNPGGPMPRMPGGDNGGYNGPPMTTSPIRPGFKKPDGTWNPGEMPTNNPTPYPMPQPTMPLGDPSMPGPTPLDGSGGSVSGSSFMGGPSAGVMQQLIQKLMAGRG